MNLNPQTQPRNLQHASTRHLQPCPPVEDFTVWWLCALPIELSAACAVLDETYDTKHIPQYTLGRVREHNVVVGCLPAGQIGLSSATAVAAEMHHKFPSLKHGFMVGIAGGVPSADADIRLGDVVISQPQGSNGGVVQYDFGKTMQDGRLMRTGSLNSPPRDLLIAAARLQSDKTECQWRINTTISTLTRPLQEGFRRPSIDTDRLFESSYNHVQGESCNHCPEERAIKRQMRRNPGINIHYGTVASGNQVIKDGLTRDRLSTELGGILCFEMEAAGLMNSFPCLVIRGICDYADSHKNKVWQPFAAAAAASCAKEVLSFTITTQVKASYHKALRFDQIYAHQMTIQPAHSKTCGWFLGRSEYREWLAAELLPSHHGLLWLKGKPGAGKSTMMKFAAASTKSKLENERNDTVVLSFYFSARGVHLERSCVGMYRSLLHQLLERFPDLQHIFGWLPDRSSEDQGYIGWDIKTLQFLFEEAVKQLGCRCVICFIDALDECNEDDVRRMVSFFEHLGSLAASSGLSFRSLFSSRHYPHIFIKEGIEIVLEDQHEHCEDIANYLQSELRDGPSKVLRMIRAEILEKAGGVFLWVVLVVPMLNKAYDHGQVHALSKLVKQLPKGLDELFEQMLLRDEVSLDELILCLQWVLFARVPLKPEELYFAIRAEFDPESVESWDRELIDIEDINRYILSVSKGLIELTKANPKTVQFIHESVRDYLFARTWLERFAPDLVENFSGLSHDRLKANCQRYTTVVACRVKNNGTALRPSLLAIADAFPVFQYSLQNLLYHADRAAEFSLPQDQFINCLLEGHWVPLRDAFEGDEDPQHCPEVSLLYTLVSQDLNNLIPAALKCAPRIDVPGYRRSSPLMAALAQQNKRVVRALLAPSIDFSANGRISPLRLLLPLADEYDETWTALFRLPSHRIHPLLWAARENKIDLVWVLLNTKKIDVNCESMISNSFAFQGNQWGIIVGDTPLLLAAQCGHETVVKLLLDTGKVNIDLRGPLGHLTPLWIAVRYGHEKTVKLLMDNGEPNIDLRCPLGHLTPLWIAVRYGHEKIVKLLLDTGKVEVDLREYYSGMTPLILAVQHGHEKIVKLLLSTGKVDVNLKDTHGNSLLAPM